MHDDSGTHTKDRQSDGKGSKRNRFFRGKQMRADDFQAEQDYFIYRRRRVTRSVLGWGVVHGFVLSGPRKPSEPCLDDQPPADPSQRDPTGAPPAQEQRVPEQQTPTSTQGASTVPTSQAMPDADGGKLTVGAGLAFDRCGRDFEQRHEQVLGPSNTFLLVGNRPKSIEDIKPGRYLLSAHYAERHVGDAPGSLFCDCDPPEKRHVCETVLYSLSELDDKECPCAERGCHRECACSAGPCRCNRGLRAHSCLCEWTRDVRTCDERALCPWGGYLTDPSQPVPLACIEVLTSTDKCNAIAVMTVEDDCGPRRLVKNNDLLFDLIRGCDLTRIVSLSWGKWHRNENMMPWETFLEFLGTPNAGHPDIQTGFTITFSKPIDAKTVTPDAFAIKFIVNHEDTGWIETRIAPVPSVYIADPAPGDPIGTTREVTLRVDAGWYEEVKSSRSKFRKEGAIVHLEVFGDYLQDCNRQAVDVNANGFALRDWGNGKPVQPSGNGTPGGLLVSIFRIDQKPANVK
jgi:hypothetical protein